MAQTSPTALQRYMADVRFTVSSLERESWQHKNVEKKIRKKLAEFANELESFTKMRTPH